MPFDRKTCPARTRLAAVRNHTIPRVLHQSWANESTVPSVLAGQAASWRTVLPTWEYHLWTDDANRRLWQEEFPELLAVYDNYSHPVMRADASRLLYMHLYGGVYADLDVAPCTSIEAALQKPQLLLVRDPWRGTLRRKQQQHISNFFFASVKGHPFWEYAIRGLANRQHHVRGIMFRTGPYFLDAMFRRFARENRLCPPWSALDANVLTYDEWQTTSFGAHHWSSTWHYNTVIEDEGLLAWLGVDSSKNCKASEPHEIFKARNGTSLFRRLKFNTYPATPGDNATRHRYVLFLQGENGAAAVKEAKLMEKLIHNLGTAEVMTSRRRVPLRKIASRRHPRLHGLSNQTGISLGTLPAGESRLSPGPPGGHMRGGV